MNEIKISVRNLVEFIMRSGDISVSSTGFRDTDAMQEGTKIHKKIQKSMGKYYHPEVSLSITSPVTYDDMEFNIIVEGRADGINIEQDKIYIDEIKGIYKDIFSLKEPIAVHRAQALVYGYIYSTENNLDSIDIQITYCHIPSEQIRRFYETISYTELSTWYNNLLNQYAKWVSWKIKWDITRTNSIKKLLFPFDYRDNQENLVRAVYQSIVREKRLYLQAPTGVGKTISTIYPAVLSMGENITEKIFYLTAKTITRTVAENTFSILEKSGLNLISTTITAKGKICILETPNCNAANCERAKGHFDRVNDAVFDIINHETRITRDKILEYADKHCVCPFEMCLDITTWCDAVICDYNYVFDPTASLKRFFANPASNNFVFLIDEAHNLVDRAREMFSASITKEDFLYLKKMIKDKNKKVASALESCNRSLLELKRNCNDTASYSSIEIDSLIIKLVRLSTLVEEYLQYSEQSFDIPKNILPLSMEEKEIFLDFYFNIKNFQNIYELVDDHYIILGRFGDSNEFILSLRCMDPSTNLDLCLKKGRSSIFFSATLLPVNYYKDQLAGREDDYAIYAPSPFPVNNRLLMIGSGVSTKYTLRSMDMYKKIAHYILKFISGKTGNYLVFFPSYKMLTEIKNVLAIMNQTKDITILIQENIMTEEKREEFLSNFIDNPSTTVVGLCVMGGIFSEGIDLTGSKLIGSVLVGTGLPMVCTENELYKNYFDKNDKNGFSYAYIYPGMNKVLQAAGRVIRTVTDKGAILLLDDRFLQPTYQNLFPKEWFPYDVVDINSIDQKLMEFWKSKT